MSEERSFQQPPLPLLIVGLGNPGKKYMHTRHNLGMRVVDKLVESFNWVLKPDNHLNGLFAKGIIYNRSVMCLMPETYMNESGWAVKRALDYYKMTPAQVIVVCDDVYIGFGQLRLRSQGSSGGHNGLKSIEAYLGTTEFMRLRMGVGSNGVEQTLADFVLSDFNASELPVLHEHIIKGVEVIKELIAKT